MRKASVATVWGSLTFLALTTATPAAEPPSSYAPVVVPEDFNATLSRMKAEMPKVMARQKALLEQRYDLADRRASGVTMSGGKPVQEGVRVKLHGGVSWEQLTQMAPEEVKGKDLWPKGFYPLPHPHHAEGGMVFPEFHIKEIKKQEGRDLTARPAEHRGLHRVRAARGLFRRDNLMHNLRTERFYTPRMVNGRHAAQDGPIKTFLLRGIKDSPPYLHDDRLLTLEDTVEFFNLVLGTRLSTQEKEDLVAFMRQL